MGVAGACDLETNAEHYTQRLPTCTHTHTHTHALLLAVSLLIFSVELSTPRLVSSFLLLTHTHVCGSVFRSTFQISFAVENLREVGSNSATLLRPRLVHVSQEGPSDAKLNC